MSTGIAELIKTSASVNEIEASSISKKLPSISKDLLKNVPEVKDSMIKVKRMLG